MKKNKILVLSPHTDDEVLGAGGSIARWVEEGHEVIVAAFTDCGVEGIKTEFFNSCDTLGVEAKSIFAGIKVRNFNVFRQFILDLMIELHKQYNPDLVLCPSKNDIHQDHQVVTQEAMRAFKHCSILGYELPWNNYAFESDYFVKLKAEHIVKKIEAVKCYKSQAHRKYCDERYIKAHAHVRGMQVGEEYAETFQLIRWIH